MILPQKILPNDYEVPQGNFIAVHDSTYNEYAHKFQAKTLRARIFYIVAYLIPGIAAYVLVNIKSVYLFLSKSLGFTGNNNPDFSR